MARKPENRFIKAVHDDLKVDYPFIYPEKTNNPFRGGIPDVYYDSPARDGWVEYKWFDKIPPVIRLSEGNDPPLSALQQHWINRAYDNGRNIAVIVGCRINNRYHGVIFGDHTGLHWDVPIEREVFTQRAIPKAGVVFEVARMLGMED